MVAVSNLFDVGSHPRGVMKLQLSAATSRMCAPPIMHRELNQHPTKEHTTVPASGRVRNRVRIRIRGRVRQHGVSWCQGSGSG
jgi:hypothetical protein